MNSTEADLLLCAEALLQQRCRLGSVHLVQSEDAVANVLCRAVSAPVQASLHGRRVVVNPRGVADTFHKGHFLQQERGCWPLKGSRRETRHCSLKHSTVILNTPLFMRLARLTKPNAPSSISTLPSSAAHPAAEQQHKRNGSHDQCELQQAGAGFDQSQTDIASHLPTRTGYAGAASKVSLQQNTEYKKSSCVNNARLSSNVLHMHRGLSLSSTHGWAPAYFQLMEQGSFVRSRLGRASGTPGTGRQTAAHGVCGTCAEAPPCAWALLLAGMLPGSARLLGRAGRHIWPRSVRDLWPWGREHLTSQDLQAGTECVVLHSLSGPCVDMGLPNLNQEGFCRACM
eukprot:365490-Chlamydomonas_euryale.AAC.2